MLEVRCVRIYLAEGSGPISDAVSGPWMPVVQMERDYESNRWAEQKVCQQTGGPGRGAGCENSFTGSAGYRSGGS